MKTSQAYNDNKTSLISLDLCSPALLFLRQLPIWCCDRLKRFRELQLWYGLYLTQWPDYDWPPLSQPCPRCDVEVSNLFESFDEKHCLDTNDQCFWILCFNFLIWRLLKTIWRVSQSSFNQTLPYTIERVYNGEGTSIYLFIINDQYFRGNITNVDNTQHIVSTSNPFYVQS